MKTLFRVFKRDCPSLCPSVRILAHTRSNNKFENLKFSANGLQGHCLRSKKRNSTVALHVAPTELAYLDHFLISIPTVISSTDVKTMVFFSAADRWALTLSTFAGLSTTVGGLLAVSFVVSRSVYHFVATTES